MAKNVKRVRRRPHDDLEDIPVTLINKYNGRFRHHDDVEAVVLAVIIEDLDCLFLPDEIETPRHAVGGIAKLWPTSFEESRGYNVSGCD